MFTRFHIERFRGIPALDIEGVKPITLLVGKNNTGKTSVLEAVFLLCGATNPYMPTVISQLRGQRITAPGDADTVWRSLFYGMTGGQSVIIRGERSGDGSRTLEIEPLEVTRYSEPVDSQPPASAEVDEGTGVGGLRLRYSAALARQPIVTTAVYDPMTRQITAESKQRDDFIRGTLLSSRSFFNLSRDTEQFSFLVRLKRADEIVRALQLIEPRTRGLSVISEASGATVYADLGGTGLVPLAVCGEGMLRVFSVVLAITGTRDGVLLIDEIDNGLHYSVMADLWPVLQKLCTEHNVQLIATTHNDEMLRHAFTAFKGNLQQLGLIRLDRAPNVFRAVSYDTDAIEGAIETNWEIRG